MKEYTKKAGLLGSYNVDGVHTAAGSAQFPSSGVNLAWAGIGQYKDQVNPCALMVYMGAIANQGKAANPRILQSIKYDNGFSAGVQIKTKTDSLIQSSTSKKLASMLRNDVISNYGQENFPGLKLYAKSGTAEIGNGSDPHSWFTGYIKNKDYPYAFVVMVEHGGWGSETAGGMANTILQKIISSDKYKGE